MAVRKIMKCADRPVIEAQSQGEFVAGSAARGYADRPHVEVHDRRAYEETHQVDEVTSLADQTTTTRVRLLRPMVQRNSARVHRHDEAFRLGNAFQHLPVCGGVR